MKFILIADMPGYKTFVEAARDIKPKDLTNHIVDYMSDAFRKCKVNTDGSSTKVIEVSIDNVAPAGGRPHADHRRRLTRTAQDEQSWREIEGGPDILGQGNLLHVGK